MKHLLKTMLGATLLCIGILFIYDATMLRPVLNKTARVVDMSYTEKDGRLAGTLTIQRGDQIFHAVVSDSFYASTRPNDRLYLTS